MYITQITNHLKTYSTNPHDNSVYLLFLMKLAHNGLITESCPNINVHIITLH